MRKIITPLLFLLSSHFLLAQTIITGTVRDAHSGQPIAGASILIKDKLTGTASDGSGEFEINTTTPFPIILQVSYIGYLKKDVEVYDSGRLTIALVPSIELLNEVVFSASRVEESIFESPVSIEKMDIRAIRETPSFSFYEGIQNLKGVEMVTSGITYKQFNTRGFNSTGNVRFLQLVDGVDNQPPGLNFAIGNLFGASDLDMENVELIPGSASALYGPVAFNGVLMMRTKDPFMYQGLSVQTKTGINHFGNAYTNPQGLYDFSARYAKAFNNRFALKVNASYLSGLDWFGTNYTDIDAQTPAEQRGDNNPARDALNIYGDEVARTIPGIGRVSRTGYEERDLMDYNAFSLKLNGSLHYRISENMELVYGYQYGKGRAAYTGSNRFMLNNFALRQHRLELKGSKYFLRGYTSEEISNDSYNARALGQQINRTWVRDLNGNPVTPDQADNTWFMRYAAAFDGSITGVQGSDHSQARTFADLGRHLPDSPGFQSEKDRLTSILGLSGAGIFSNSKFYHAEGQYDLSDLINVVDILVGGNFRLYDMFTDGTLLDDANQDIKINEGGAFIQASKKLFEDKLKLVASQRYDKNENFKGRFTPRAAAVLTIARDHNLRASFQTGFRNPTPVDQFIKLNAGPITILGGVPANSVGMNVYENSFTAGSVGAFGAAFGGAVGGGASPEQALMDNKDLLEKSNVDYIKPERVSTFEIGYRGIFANKLSVDANFYHSNFTDFILNTVVIQPGSDALLADGSINPAAASDVLSGNMQAFQLYTNAADRVSSQGATLGITYLFDKGYTLNANGTWAAFNILDANPENIPAFNTPVFRTAVTFGNNSLTDRLGFNVAWRWQDAFDWVSTFTQLHPGRIEAYSIFDAQVSYKLPSIKSMVKVGASNLFNNQVYQAYGSPSIGGIYYLTLTFDELFR